jgi:hypothetical protein
MAFVVRTQKQRLDKPEGHYITVHEREWLVQEVKMTPSGNIVVVVEDPVRLERQIFTACTIDQLSLLIS